MGQLRLKLLGPPAIIHAGHEVHLPTRRALLLLARLAVDPGPHSRERLAGLLWPDSDDERARTSLRTHIGFLRTAIGGDHLRATTGAIALEPAELDLVAAASAAALARQTYDVVPEPVWLQLSDAAEAIGEEFLGGVSVAGIAAELQGWIDGQRDLWLGRATAVLDQLSEWQIRKGELAGAVEMAQRRLRLDAFDEACHRRLIELHLLRGNRAAALRAYEECRRLLSEELGAEPEPETDQLAERARSRPDTAPALAPSRYTSPMVGRDQSLGRLIAAYRAASEAPGLVVVTGEAGIGKSRLAHEFLDWAADQGAEVLDGRAFESSTPIPFQPVVEALRRRLERDPALAASMLPAVWVARLARLLPELGAPRRREEPEQDRAHLFEAVARLLRGLASRRALVLFIDDVHWADAASLDLLRYAGRELAHSRTPVLVVLAMRSEELAVRPDLQLWLNSLEAELGGDRLELGPLPPEDTRRLLEATSPSLSGHAITVHAESGGHPLFLIETLQFWRQRGGPPETGRLLAPGVRDAIRSRLTVLAPEASEVAAAAAVIGSRSSFDALLEVSALGERECLRALEELVRRRFLVASPPGYALSHDRVREVVYDDAGQARRLVMHRRALAELTQRGAPAAERLRHLEVIGNPQQVADAAVEAGEEAMALSAGATAAAHFERALEMRGVANPGLMQRLGDAQRLAERLPDAGATYRSMLAAAMATGDQRAQAIALSRLALVAAQTFGVVDEDPVVLLRQALAIADRSGQDDLSAEALAALSLALMLRIEFDAAEEAGRRAVTLASGLGLDEVEAQALTGIVQAKLFGGAWEGMAELAERAASIQERRGDLAMLANALSLASGGRLREGDLGMAMEHARRALGIAREIDNPWDIATACFHLGEALLTAGDIAGTDACAEEGVAAGRRSGFVPMLSVNLALMGWGRLAGGRPEEAGAAFTEARDSIDPSVPIPVFREMAWRGIATVAHFAGDGASAQRAEEEATRLRSPASPFGWALTEAGRRAAGVL